MMIDDVLKTIKSSSSGIYKKSKSRFLAYAFPVDTEAKVKEIQKEIRKKHYDAKHHVYAFVLAEKNAYRYSDDGEPSRSSGPPVLNVIKSFGLTNILIIVVRYFGGKKLGIPGLITAYRSAAEDAVNNAEIITKTIDDRLYLLFDYNVLDRVMYLCDKSGANISERVFSDRCSLVVGIRRKSSSDLKRQLEDIGVDVQV